MNISRESASTWLSSTAHNQSSNNSISSDGSNSGVISEDDLSPQVWDLRWFAILSAPLLFGTIMYNYLAIGDRSSYAKYMSLLCQASDILGCCTESVYGITCNSCLRDGCTHPHEALGRLSHSRCFLHDMERTAAPVASLCPNHVGIASACSLDHRSGRL